jgi:hypothetical protein
MLRTERERWNRSRVRAAANPAASRNHISPLVTSCYIMLIFAHSTKPCSFVLGVALIVSDVSRARKSFPPRWALEQLYMHACWWIVPEPSLSPYWRHGTHLLLSVLLLFAFCAHRPTPLYLASSANWFLCSKQMRARLSHTEVWVMCISTPSREWERMKLLIPMQLLITHRLVERHAKGKKLCVGARDLTIWWKICRCVNFKRLKSINSERAAAATAICCAFDGW